MEIKKIGHKSILIFILLIIMVSAFFSEKILVHEGLGFDGGYYGEFTKNFKTYISTHGINSYHFQRIAIPFLIYNTFSILNIALTNPNIILAFSIINICFIILGVFYYFRISRILNLSRNTEIIGFCSLFFCFPVLKLCPYYPVLMDIPAYGLTIVLMYHYIQQRVVYFFILILVGSFIYPTFIILSVLLFFKSPTGNSKSSNSTLNLDTKQSPLLDRGDLPRFLFCFTLPIALCIMYVVLFWRNDYKMITDELKNNFTVTAIIWSSFFICLVYLTYLSYFPKSFFSIREIFKSINPLAIVLTILVIIITKIIIEVYASKEKSPLTLNSYLYNIIFQGVKNPVNFIVAHVFYYGTSILLAFFMLKKLKQEIMNFGFGMILFFNLAAFFSVGNESRQLINYYPIFIIILLIVLDKYYKISTAFILIFGAINLGLSHFWFKINKGVDASTDYGDYFSLFEFPKQRYFMFQGPWVSDFMYKVHLGIFILLLLILFVIFKKTKFITLKNVNQEQNNK